MAKDETKAAILEAQKKLESEIRKIAAAIQQLQSGPIKRDVLFHLISWKSGVPQRTVADILDTIASLERHILK